MPSESISMMASKFGAREIAIRIGAAYGVEEIVFVPIFGGAHGHDLLREDVERRFGNREAVEFALAHGAHQRGAFEQFIARGGEDAALGHGAAPVAGAADALQGDGNRARRADLADQIDAADVDAQFERGGGHQRAQLAGFQLVLGREPQLARQAAVVRGHGFLAQALAQMHARRAPPAGAC